jgi:sigma-B regulation protein RsbU (phosphoserine phosphatase)
MPPGLLGVIFLVAFFASFVLRRPLERTLVLSHPEPAQPKRQFFLDFFLCLTAGALVIAFNNLFYDFPVASSGSKVILGCTVAGFFLSMDTALARERSVIHNAISGDTVLPSPKRLYSMTRKFSLVAFIATLLVSAIMGLVILGDISWLVTIGQSGMSVARAQQAVLYEVFFVMAVLLAWVVNLIFSYSRNLKLLFHNETSVLQQVSRGDLSKLVPVATNDEFGVIAGHTNTMIQGLRHRIKLITALKLAEEVQQNLLPQVPPSLPGFNVAGISDYCDETGGDYFDYFEMPSGSLGVVVADASEHGVGAALLMTTARALLRQRVAMTGSIARIVSDVNRELARDVEETGRFMTMFFLGIDPEARTIGWVRAGHDPAILYDAGEATFSELSGEGIALGVVEDFEYQEYTQQGWSPGSVIVVGTDGIREARNDKSEMFGMDRFREVIGKHATEPAETIQNAIIDTLRNFQGDAPQEDDITLVVVKLL